MGLAAFIPASKIKDGWLSWADETPPPAPRSPQKNTVSRAAWAMAQSLVTTFALGFSPHIECNACLDLLLGAYTVDTLLHLPVAPIATLHRIRGRGEQFVIEKRQSFLEGRRKEFLQRLTQMLEPVQATPQIGQLVEGGLRATPSVEQPVDLLHDLAQLAELG